MAFPKRQAAIVGVYLTEQAPSIDRSAVSLELEAFKGALDDAGLTFKDVDGIITYRDSSPIGGSPDPHMYWAEQLGQRPIRYTGRGHASAELGKVAVAIAAGMVDTAVMVWGQAGRRINPAKAAMPTAAPRMGEWSHMIWGAYMIPWYALWAQRYMHDFGITSEDLAEVSVATRYHATMNPRSIMGKRGEITVEDVINSRMLASPLHLLDCCLDNDGGYAIVITTAEKAKTLKKKPIYILGGAEAVYTDFYVNIDKPWINAEKGQSVRRAADTAFSLAGVTRDDIDVACMYDCFSVTLLRDLEEVGFCKVGEAGDFVKGGALRVGGRLPTNTHGGLLSMSHNGHPHGMHTIEVVQQLRGDEVEPGRQVKDAKIGLSLAQGMSVHGKAGVLIMAKD